MDPWGPVDARWLSTASHRDTRGVLHAWFDGEAVRRATGREVTVTRANATVSRRGALRGIKYSLATAKYVTCLRGAVFDVVVDLRVGSPGFGRWRGRRLDGDTPGALYLGAGLGHACLALGDDTVVAYLLGGPAGTASDVAEAERTVHPFARELGIAWPSSPRPILSERDACAPGLHAARDSGLLPVHHRSTA
ncbi:dTDP-4-keto-6-deoxy-D-glucose epimerase [Saccharothrix syringae]|uniref:dTDP-4-keto-6-deoxy-D-glucose epimerase n=1 Tax=Saccharothrix syringae TaxID=103733 RepID=A0A5Q0HEB3_SACSY|nr:dTDP-4-keto-6-deoxy-D-glucose epimerase [Saccharothrix syringae]